MKPSLEKILGDKFLAKAVKKLCRDKSITVKKKENSIVIKYIKYLFGRKKTIAEIFPKKRIVYLNYKEETISFIHPKLNELTGLFCAEDYELKFS